VKAKKETAASRNVETVAAGSPARGDKWATSLQSVFDLVLDNQGPDRTAQLLDQLAGRLKAVNQGLPRVSNTPYVNTIPAEQQADYPGDWETEHRLKSYMRWNAMAMVVRANSATNVGGHISTYASCATLYEVAFNHFFRGFLPRSDRCFPRRSGLFSGTRGAGCVCAGLS